MVNDPLEASERIKSSEACELIRQLEQLLEMPVVTIVTSRRPAELSFVFPGESDGPYMRSALGLIATAARYALKSR